MRMGQGVRTGLGHGGITCVLQTQLSIFFSDLHALSKFAYYKELEIRVVGFVLKKLLTYLEMLMKYHMLYIV